MKCISIFRCNPQIEVIDKSHASLEDVPNFQNYSKSLEELSLEANRLRMLNDNLFRLTRLRRLNLSDNEIEYIPPDIAKLVNLVEIYGSRNKIQAIPEQIKFLRGLQICDFSANCILDLPVGLVQLKNLTSLTLDSCLIESLPEDIGLLKNLEFLELRENRLQTLPRSIAGLESLRRLDVGKNSIRELPDEIGRLSKLEDLQVDENFLISVPSTIGKLKNLQCLDLRGQGNDPEDPDEDPERPGRRKKLTELRYLPDEIGGLINLTDLDVSDNRLQSLPDSIRSLKSLTLFNAAENELTELNSNIGGCTSLQELIVTRNKISKLPISIGCLTDLRLLNLDENLLEQLPPQIGNLRKLGILSLRDNNLTYLPDEIGNLENLTVLYVNDNWLQYLPVSIASLNLGALWLVGNQANPLPKLQIDESPEGKKVLTCYLLPQHKENIDLDYKSTRKLADDDSNVDHQRQAAVSFDTAAVDDVDLDDNAQFVRHDTPHPRELKARHQKLFEIAARPELKGVDNASFNLADVQQQRYRNINNNVDISDNYEHHEQQQQPNSPGYQHLEYESNGLPEIPTSQSASKSRSHVQTTTKLFEAFRQKSTSSVDYPTRQSEDRYSTRDSGSFESKDTKHHNGQSNNRNSRSSNDFESTVNVLDILVRRSAHHKPGLGLSIAGGKDTPPFKDNDEGIFVSKVTHGGPAEAAGVRTSDKILAVNDNIFYDGITHQRAVEIFKKIKPDFKEFKIRVLRDPNDDQLNDDHDIDFNSSRSIGGKGDDATLTISTNRVADRTPISQSTFTRTYTVPIKSESTSTGNSVNNLRQYLMQEPERTVKSNASTLPSGMSLNDTSSLAGRNNIIYTTLVKDYKHDLGLTLENRSDENDSKSTWSNIVISDIKPNSIASRDGKLQVDDRLLSINGADVTGIDLERIMLMLEGTERFIRIVVSRGDGDDPLGIALRNMPARPSLGSWFSSTSNMSRRPSLIESYQRPTFGSVSSLSKQPAQLLGTKPPKPPKPSYLVTKDSEDSTTPTNLGEPDDNPIARPRSRVTGLAQSESGEHQASMSDAERRAVWRRERLKSIEDDVEMAKLIAEAQRRRREEK